MSLKNCTKAGETIRIQASSTDFTPRQFSIKRVSCYMKRTPAPIIVNKLFLNIKWMHGDADVYTFTQHEYETEKALKAAITAVQNILQYQNDFWNDMCDVYDCECSSGKAVKILKALEVDSISEYFKKFGIQSESDSTCEDRWAMLQSFTAEEYDSEGRKFIIEI